MNKKGFTLIELMVVIVIIAVTSVSSVIVFGNIDDDTKEENQINMYKQVQRAGILYTELHSSYIEEFSAENKLFISYTNLLNNNYITKDVDKKIKDKEKENYLVKLFVLKDDFEKKYQSSSIVKVIESNIYMCVADSNGNYEKYKNYIPYVSTSDEFNNSPYLKDLYDDVKNTKTEDKKYEKYNSDINKLINECGSLERYINCGCY